MKEYDKAIVNYKRIAYNPCALDEYEVTIKPHDRPEQVIYTFGDLFESDEAICDRIYQQWKNESK